MGPRRPRTSLYPVRTPPPPVGGLDIIGVYSHTTERWLGLAAILLFLFLLPSATHAALEAPSLQNPTATCSGSNPFVTLVWSSVADATSYEVLRNGILLTTTAGTTIDDAAVNPKENHTYAVRARNATETSALSNANSITVPRCGPVLTIAGTECIVTGPKINLSWNGLAEVTDYQVLRSGTAIATLPAPQTTYSDTTAVGNESYTYTVRAVWPDESKDSNTSPATKAPACPPTLTAVGNCNAPGAQASLSWLELAGVTEYQIFKDNNYLTSVPGSDTSFDDKNVQQLTSYNYFVRAVYSTETADSNTNAASIPRCAPVLAAQNACNADNPTIPEVLLSWTPTAGAANYDIYEILKGFIKQVVSSPSTIASFLDGSKIENGTSYTFNVKAIGAFDALTSNDASITPSCSASTIPSPAPVLEVAPVCVSGISQMNLSWTPSNSVLYYTFTRRNNSTGETRSKNVSSATTSETDANIEVGVSYTYTITAVGNGGGVNSNSVTKTSVSCVPPSTPTLANPAPACASGSPLINLSWAKSTNATGYQIYRDGSLLNEISDPNTIAYSDLAVNNSTTYSYEIRAVGPGGVTSSGPPKTVTTSNCASPTAPTLSLAAPACGGSGVFIALNWTASTNAVYYDIYRKKSGEASFARIVSGLTSTSYADGGLPQGLVEVSYFVMAVGPAGTGSTSSNMESRSTPYCPPARPSLDIAPVCLGSQPTMNLTWANRLMLGYNLDENSGLNAYDLSGSGGDGTLTGGPAWVAGKTGSALSFDGADDRVRLANGSAANVTGDITLAAWINPTFATSGALMHKDGQYTLYIYSSGRISWADSSNWSYSNFGAYNVGLRANQWQHIAVTKSGGTVKVYVDGAERLARNFGGSIGSTGSILHIGCYAGGAACSSSYFAGRVDDVRIYNRALAPTEIIADMNSPVTAGNGAVQRYDIKRDGTTIAQPTPPTASFSDDAVVSSTSYSYAVTAVGPGGSATSNTASAAALVCAAPSKPTVIWETLCSASNPQIKLTWDPTANTASYDVFRGAVKLTSTPIPFSSTATSYSFTDSGPLNANTSYSYTVVANGLSGTGSTSSDVVPAKTGFCQPSKPALTVTPQCSSGKSVYKLTWTDPTPSNTTAYEIRRDGTLIVPPPTLAPPTATFTDDNGGAGFPSGENHSYTVTAVGPQGSNASDPKSGTALNCANPGQPVISALTLACTGSKALSFNGASHYVDLGNPADLRLRDDQTIEMWLRPNVFLGTRQNPYAKAYGGEGTLTIETDGSVSYYYGTCGGNCEPYQWAGLTTYKLTANRWNHIVLVRDLANMKIRWYKDGVLSDEYPAAYSRAANSPLNAYIGQGYTSRYSGGIDEVRVYNRALSAAEVAAHYDSGRGQYGAPENGLRGGWHFDETDGDVLTDYSGRGNNGTIIASPTRIESAVASSGIDPRPLQQVQIGWTAVPNTSLYEVFRGAAKIATIPVTDPARTNYSFADTSGFASSYLTANTSYDYKVSAINSASGISTASPVKTTAPLPMCSPTTPTWWTGYPRALCSGDKSAAQLFWTYAQPTSHSKNFEIKRVTAGTGETTTQTLAASGFGSQSFTDTNSGAGLVSGTDYSYQITGIGPTGLKNASASRTVTASFCSLPAPSTISACTLSAYNPVTNISWQRPSGETWFFLYRKRATESFFSFVQWVSNYNDSSPTMLREWLVLGPFPNSPDPIGYDTDYIAQSTSNTANESTVRPRAGETLGGKSWTRSVVSSATDYVDLNGIYGTQSNVVAYAVTYVMNTTGAPITGQLRLGSDDGIKAYVNGAKIHDNHIHRSAARDQDRPAVTLNPGLNTILLKIDQGGSGWGFYARLTTNSGNPLLSTITSTDSTIAPNQSAEYYVMTSPSFITSPISTAPAQNCAPDKTTVTLAPACEAGQTLMNIEWAATANTASYNVYRVGSATALNTTPITHSPSQLTYRFTDQNLEEELNYSYYVNSIGSSTTASDAASASTLLCALRPDKPQLTSADVSPVCAGTASRVVLDWPDTVNAVTYTVHRNNVALTPTVSSSAFTDGAVTGGNQYAYKVEAVGSGGSSFSDEITVTALDCSGPPVPPTLKQASVLFSPTSVFLNWDDNSLNELGFRIHRTQSIASNKFLFAQISAGLRQIALALTPDLLANATAFTDTQPQEDATYEYRVEAFNDAGSTFSNSKTIYVPISPPGNFNLLLKCSLSSTPRRIALDWSPGADTTAKGGPVTYNAFWSLNELGPYTLLPAPCSIDIQETSCAVDAPAEGLVWYKVTARNNGGTTDALSSSSCEPIKWREIIPQ
ncbi:hypothetical protein HYW67_04185 [Candidatus Parcubacteria bacterium]|nr:hypothetical protein [Candidatus Parcubacteria bacterium]